MLAHRLGRLPDIKSTLVQCIVFAVLLSDPAKCWLNVGPPSAMLAQQ